MENAGMENAGNHGKTARNNSLVVTVYAVVVWNSARKCFCELFKKIQKRNRSKTYRCFIEYFCQQIQVNKDVARTLIGGCIFIYSCSARRVSFQIDQSELELKRN